MATVAEALTLAFDLQAGGRRDEAHELLRRILSVAADQPDAHHLIGLLDGGDGDYGRAVARLRCAAALAPARADVARNLAVAQAAAGLPAAAQLGALRVAASASPLDPEWSARLAQTALTAGRFETAAAAARRLATLQPDLAEGRRIAGEAAHALQDADDAATALIRRARLSATDAAAWNAAGAAARKADRQGAAIGAFKTALILDPGNLGATATLANALRDDGRLAEAVAAGERALRLSGGDPAADPSGGDPTIEWNLAIILLTAGRFAEGRRALEARWRARGFPTAVRSDLTAPLWRGEDPRGRSILLYEEQGRGDALQFIRYAAPTAALGARVVVQVGADLVPLFSRSLAGTATVVAAGDPVPPVDFVCPLMSLPRAFDLTAVDPPVRIPYLTADPEKAARWRERLHGAATEATEDLKVGVVWAGNPSFADDGRRSPGPGPLAPLFAVPGVRWFGLRTGSTPHPHFTDLGPADLADFSDTAAVMVNLDLVISSCTAAAHLAGALGRPVWTLLARAADWRWLTDRDDSPWYPSMRLFRQKRAGDWASATTEAAQALRALRRKP